MLKYSFIEEMTLINTAASFLWAFRMKKCEPKFYSFKTQLESWNKSPNRLVSK